MLSVIIYQITPDKNSQYRGITNVWLLAMILDLNFNMEVGIKGSQACSLAQKLEVCHSQFTRVISVWLICGILIDMQRSCHPVKKFDIYKCVYIYVCVYMCVYACVYTTQMYMYIITFYYVAILKYGNPMSHYSISSGLSTHIACISVPTVPQCTQVPTPIIRV